MRTSKVEPIEFYYQGGLTAYVQFLNSRKSTLNKIIPFNGESNGIKVEGALQWNDGYNEICFALLITFLKEMEEHIYRVFDQH